MLEQELKPSSLEELYVSLDQIKPTDFDDIIVVNGESDVKQGVAAEFTWRIKSPEVLSMIPKFAWSDIFGRFHLEHQKKSKRQ